MTEQPVKIKSFPSNSISVYAVLIILASVIVIHICSGNWKNYYKVMGGDGLSYYSYMSVTFLYQDLKMTFYDPEDGDMQRIFFSFPKPTPTGNWVIPTTSGMAILALPFFLVSHFFALFSPYPASGYSEPYNIGLILCSLFYFMIGLVYLRKLLLFFFNEGITTISILTIFFGTNLLYYVTEQPFMSHIYSFTLITLFIYYTIRWHSIPNIRNSLLIGLILGFIALIRPSNILVIFIFLLWNVFTFNDLRERTVLFVKKIPLVAVMVLMFILVWIPQFIYWKYVTGSYFFWSYGEGAGFFFNNPQILNVLFSFRKGWLLYTPVMVFALAGFWFLYKKVPGIFYGAILTFIFFLYIISSWWSWWYGESFSQRSFVDIYCILVFPLASTLNFAFRQKKYLSFIIAPVLALLIFMNLFQTWQINNGLLHPISMSKESYRIHFLKTKFNKQFYNSLIFPDYAGAREGKYYTENEMTEPERQKLIKSHLRTKEDSVNYFKKSITSDPEYFEFVKNKATAKNISYDEMLEKESEWLYQSSLDSLLKQTDPIAYYVRQIKNDSNYFEFVKQKAIKKNIPVEEMIRLDAEWLYEEDKKKEDN